MKTEDPFVIIEKQTSEYKIYRNITNKERWIISGKCNCCGQCEVGTANPNIVWTGIPVGEPYSEYDITFGKRKDMPVRPEIAKKNPNCTLSGEYLP